MAIKAVFFDIDGTFLNDRKRVSSSTKKAISQMKEDGILVGLATGRGPGLFSLSWTIWVWILQSLIMVNIF